MAKRKGPRIWVVDGIDHCFDNAKFKLVIQKRKHENKNKNISEVEAEIATTISVAPDTVEGWYKGNAGPSTIDMVHALEMSLNLQANTLLKKTTGQEETTVCKTPDYERNAARELYGLLCDLVDDLEFRSEVLITGVEGKAQGFRLLEKEPQPWLCCDELIKTIRKIGFDLPKETRDALMVFVYETFEVGDRNGELYFESDWYKAFLKKEGVQDTERSRKKFSNFYIEDRYETLDAIFVDYLQKEE